MYVFLLLILWAYGMPSWWLFYFPCLLLFAVISGPADWLISLLILGCIFLHLHTLGIGHYEFYLIRSWIVLPLHILELWDMMKLLGLSLIFWLLFFTFVWWTSSVCVVLGGFISSAEARSFLICKGCSLYSGALNSGYWDLVPFHWALHGVACHNPGVDYFLGLEAFPHALTRSLRS